jgi:GNAT superfamily N-acetyltransferase
MAVPALLSATSAYPADQSFAVTLRDGSRVGIRPVQSGDRAGIRIFLGLLSHESVFLRFFGAADLDRASEWSVDVDYAARYGFVATTEPLHTIVAHGAYVLEAPGRAEVAFVVSDALQGHGIATILLTHLAEVAAAHGILVFTAEILPYNERMLDVFRDSGFPIDLRTRDGVVHVELPTSQ